MRRATLGGMSAVQANNRPSVGASRNSSIGVKRQSYAPQPRKSSVGGDLGRRSLAISRGAASSKADPRPANDRKYVIESMKRVVAYLVETGYPNYITEKAITNPTTKMYQDILEFLLQRLDPNFKLDTNRNRFEEEVIMIFRSLGYPFEIRKQWLSAVGSPHSWPQLVLTLTWLMDILEYDAEVQQRRDEDSFDQNGIFDIFFDYVARSYRRFLYDGEELTAERDDELSMALDANNAKVKADLQKLGDANTELVAQRDKLVSEKTPLELVAARNADLRSDIEKFDAIIADLRNHEQMVQGKVSDQEEQAHALSAEAARISEENERLAAQVAAQELSPADVERMTGERNRQAEALKELVADKAELLAKIDAAEQDRAARFVALQSQLDDYAARAERQQLLPASAENAQGCDLACVLVDGPVGEGRPRVLSSDLLQMVKPPLAELKARYTKDVYVAQEDLLKLQEQVDRSEQARQDKEDEIADLERKASKMEAIFASEKETLFSDVDEQQRQADQVLNEALELRSKLAAKRLTSQQAVKAAAAEVEEQRKQWAQEREEMYSGLIRTLDRLMNHKEHVRDRLQSVLSAAEQAHAAVSS